MAKLVQKSGYIKSGKAGGYMRYIATREGVERLAGNGAVTKGQRELIQKLLTDFPDAVELFEYEDYCKTPTLGTASTFITMALDANLHEIDSESGYMQYIATRPRVQKRGTHGLFSSATAVDLASAISELEAHEGNVWTIIYSLRREDAARLEYDNADAWRTLLMENAPTLAKSMKISLENFHWYAAFHDEGHHPHIHMMVWSDDPKEGFLTKDGIAAMRSKLTNAIFRDEMQQKSAIFLILPEEDTTKNFMAGLMIQNLSRELFAVADENGGKLQNRVVLYCDEFGTMPPFDVLPLFSAGRSRRLTLVPIIQSLAQLEKNYGKEGSEIIQDNCQDTIFGGFAPNSQTAEVLSKALGNRTVLSGSVSRGKNDPSQSLQMMERPLLTPDELKSIPKGNFIVQKTGQHPMRTRLRLFPEWGITFEEPYIVPERADRAVAYANREDLEHNLPKSNKAEDVDVSGAYAVSGRGGMAHEPAVDKPRRMGGKQMKTYGEEDL